MASKNITIALFLTINLVFLGFTTAQAPGPQAPTCPRSSTQIQACVSGITSILGPLNPLTASPCCTLVAGLDASVASVCLCNALSVGVPRLLQIQLFTPLLNLCRVPPPAGFTCA